MKLNKIYYLFFAVYSCVTLCDTAIAQNTFSKSIDVHQIPSTGTSIITLDDGYLVQVRSVCFPLTRCYSIIKTDFKGQVLWKKNFNNGISFEPGNTAGGNVMHSINDTLYFAGNIKDTTTNLDVMLFKTSPLGDSLKVISFDQNLFDGSFSMLHNSDSTF